MTARPHLLLLLALAGCGDAAVDETFVGEVLATFDFEIGVPPGPDRTPIEVDFEPGLRVAVFWHVDGFEGDLDRLVEQPSTGVAITDRLNAIAVRERPPGEAVIDGAYAVGRLLAYVDADGDGLKGPDEALVAELSGAALILALRPLEAGEGPFARRLPVGLHRQGLPIACDGPPITGPTCAVPLGEPCEADGATCDPGVCQYAIGPQHPEAALWCVAAYDPEGCAADGGRFVPEWDGDPATTAGHFAPACAADADCAGLAGPHCAPVHGACHGAIPPSMLLTGVNLQPLCDRDDGPDLIRRPGMSGPPMGGPPMGGPPPPPGG